SVRMPSKNEALLTDNRSKKKNSIKPVVLGPGVLSRVKDWLKGNF
ncbi:hypothetical protein SAMN05421760_102556, partial [Neptunomonas antarctica]